MKNRRGPARALPLVVLLAAVVLGNWRPPKDEGVIDWIYPSINELVHTTHAAVIGEVQQIGEPRWNNADADVEFAPEDTGDAYLMPTKYRAVTIRVERVLWATPEVPAEAGDELRFVAGGDGTSSGANIAGTIRENNSSGPLEEDGRHLLLLRMKAFNLKKGSGVLRERRLGLNSGFLGNWKLDDGRALSALKGRTVDETPLVERLLEELSRGRQSDPSGKRDPLEKLGRSDSANS